MADPFVELLDAVRAEVLVAARTRERWIRRLAEEEATLTGTLLDLAEQGTTVSLRTSAGRPTNGVVVAVGRDFCAVRTAAGRTGCLVLAAVTRLRPAGGNRPAVASGHRGPALDLTLGELLARAVADRPTVHLLADGDGEAVVGELRSVSAELLTVVPEGDARARCFVPVASLAEVWFASG